MCPCPRLIVWAESANGLSCALSSDHQARGTKHLIWRRCTMQGKVEGRVALVTGAGRGIGRSVALKLAGEGAHVVVNDLDAEPTQAVVDEIRAAGGEAIGFPGSVTAPDF